MPGADKNNAVRLSKWFYARLLSIYPTEHRRDYGPVMEQLFADQCGDAWREARGWGVAGLWLRIFPDLLKTSFLEHLASLKERKQNKPMPSINGNFIRSHRGLILVIIALLCAFTATQLKFWLPKEYASTVQIQVEKDMPAIPPVGAGPSGQSFDPYFLATQMAIVKSQSILRDVIVGLRLDRTLAFQNGSGSWTADETFDYLQKHISVVQTRGTSMIEITVRNHSATIARDIANAIADSYQKYRGVQRTSSVPNVAVVRNWARVENQPVWPPPLPANLLLLGIVAAGSFAAGAFLTFFYARLGNRVSTAP